MLVIVLNEIKVKTQLNKTNSLMYLHLTAEIWPRGQLFSHVNYNLWPVKKRLFLIIYFSPLNLLISLLKP